MKTRCGDGSSNGTVNQDPIWEWAPEVSEGTLGSLGVNGKSPVEVSKVRISALEPPPLQGRTALPSLMFFLRPEFAQLIAETSPAASMTAFVQGEENPLRNMHI